MSTRSIVQATQLGKSTVSILVDTEFTESLHSFLEEHGARCRPPMAAIFRPARLVSDHQGRVIREEEAIVHELLMEGTLSDFQQLLAAWVSPTPSHAAPFTVPTEVPPTEASLIALGLLDASGELTALGRKVAEEILRRR
jgi:hypothetical protein